MVVQVSVVKERLTTCWPTDLAIKEKLGRAQPSPLTSITTNTVSSRLSPRVLNASTPSAPNQFGICMNLRNMDCRKTLPIGYRYSDDDGRIWSEVRIIRPKNDPDFRGMSVMRMTETDSGTWLLGSHEADWSYIPIMTRQYLLRSEDQGRTWELLPGQRHGGWYAKGFNRMDEGRPINLGNGNVFLMTRTATGYLWGSWSEDDGKSWTYPKPTPLVHPDAPPMLFKLSDGKTLIAFHHNRSKIQTADLAGNRSQHYDRSEIWFSISVDGGRSWSEPQFVFATALEPFFDNIWRDFNTSYLDAFIDDGVINLFCPHRWERVLYLKIMEKDLYKFPTRKQFLD